MYKHCITYIIAIASLIYLPLCWSKGTHVQLGCVALNGLDSPLNRHLCEEIGLEPCSKPLGVLAFNSDVVSHALDREKCLETVLGLLSQVACKKGKWAIGSKEGPFVVYVCEAACIDVWKACSPRANHQFADILAHDESKRMCKSLTLPQSHVQIRHGSQGNCLDRIVGLNNEQVAEIDWLLGGKMSSSFIKAKIHALGIIFLTILMAVASVYTRYGYLETKRKWAYKINADNYKVEELELEI